MGVIVGKRGRLTSPTVRSTPNTEEEEKIRGRKRGHGNNKNKWKGGNSPHNHTHEALYCLSLLFRGWNKVEGGTVMLITCLNVATRKKIERKEIYKIILCREKTSVGKKKLSGGLF